MATSSGMNAALNLLAAAVRAVRSMVKRAVRNAIAPPTIAPTIAATTGRIGLYDPLFATATPQHYGSRRYRSLHVASLGPIRTERVVVLSRHFHKTDTNRTDFPAFES